MKQLGRWSQDERDWPAHLRSDAPTQTCSGCGRTTRGPDTFGGPCGMPQPDGTRCPGEFRLEVDDA